MLVRQSVGKFVDQRGVLPAGFTHDVQAPGAVVVKRGCLLGQQVYGGALQVEVPGNQPELLESDFLGAQVLGLHRLAHPLFYVAAELLPVHGVVAHLVELPETGDLGELAHHAAELEGGLGGLRRRLGQAGRPQPGAGREKGEETTLHRYLIPAYVRMVVWSTSPNRSRT